MISYLVSFSPNISFSLSAHWPSDSPNPILFPIYSYILSGFFCVDDQVCIYTYGSDPCACLSICLHVSIHYLAFDSFKQKNLKSVWDRAPFHYLPDLILITLLLSSSHSDLVSQKCHTGTSLVVQWLRIRLPMQGTRVRALVREDPTCPGATKPMRHNYWACALEPASHNYWACVPQLLKPACLDPCSATREATAMRSLRTATKSSPHLVQLEKAHVQQRRPNAAKNKLINSLKKKATHTATSGPLLWLFCSPESFFLQVSTFSLPPCILTFVQM